MYCNNKNYLLDLFYNEGTKAHLIDIKNHVENCEVCKQNFEELKKTLQIFDSVKTEKPAPIVLENLIKTVNNTMPEVETNNLESSKFIRPIIEIIFSLIFVFTIIYLISLKLSLSKIWEYLKVNSIVNAIGPTGVAVIIFLMLGTFITLAISPVLLLSYKQRKNF